MLSEVGETLISNGKDSPDRVPRLLKLRSARRFPGSSCDNSSSNDLMPDSGMPMDPWIRGGLPGIITMVNT